MNALRPVLYVEDDENDIFFMQHAWKKADIHNPLTVVRTGEEAIQFLDAQSRTPTRPGHRAPCLILLDLKLPLCSGLDVLRWIRHESAVRSIQVVILTSSNQDRDIHEAYNLGASGYLIKPPTPMELTKLMKNLKRFWLQRSPQPEPLQCHDQPGSKPPDHGPHPGS